jgi:predicted Zn-dependent peptidase
MVINVLFDKKIYKKTNLEKSVEQLKRDMVRIDHRIFEIEKSRVISELDEKTKAPLYLFSQRVRSNMFTEPRPILFSKSDQQKNIPRLGRADVERCVRKIIDSPQMIFVGYRGSKSKPPKEISFLRKLIGVELSKPGKYPLERGFGSYAVGFKSSCLEDSPLDRYAAGYIVLNLAAVLGHIARELGAYELYREHFIEYGFGYAWFGIHSYHSSAKKFDRKLFEALRKVSSSEYIQSNLAEYKKQKMDEVKKDWMDPGERQDWIVGEYAGMGKAFGLEAALKGIRTLSVSRIQKIARKFFNKNKAYILSNRINR